jgi:hypothetical protein
MPFVLILVIGIALMAGTLALVVTWERRRARLLKEAGTALGLRAFEKGEQLAVPSVEIMRKRGRTIGAALEGTWQGESIVVFDLSYPAGSNVARTTVFMLRLSEPRIPEFAAIRKNIWLYTPTVDLPKVKEQPSSLKRHWFLYATGGQWPFHDEVTECLGGNSGWSFEGRGSGLFLYTRAKRAPSKTLKAWLDTALAEAREFARHIPAAGPDSMIDDGQPPSGHKRVFTFKASWRN